MVGTVKLKPLYIKDNTRTHFENNPHHNAYLIVFLIFSEYFIPVNILECLKAGNKARSLRKIGYIEHYKIVDNFKWKSGFPWYTTLQVHDLPKFGGNHQKIGLDNVFFNYHWQNVWSNRTKMLFRLISRHAWLLI